LKLNLDKGRLDRSVSAIPVHKHSHFHRSPTAMIERLPASGAAFRMFGQDVRLLYAPIEAGIWS
jgi:hypothetical protein